MQASTKRLETSKSLQLWHFRIPLKVVWTPQTKNALLHLAPDAQTAGRCLYSILSSTKFAWIRSWYTFGITKRMAYNYGENFWNPLEKSFCENNFKYAFKTELEYWGVCKTLLRPVQRAWESMLRWSLNLIVLRKVLLNVYEGFDVHSAKAERQTPTAPNVQSQSASNTWDHQLARTALSIVRHTINYHENCHDKYFFSCVFHKNFLFNTILLF